MARSLWWHEPQAIRVCGRGFLFESVSEISASTSIGSAEMLLEVLSLVRFLPSLPVL